MAKRTSRNIEAKETLDLMRAQITKLDEQIEKADTLAEKGKKRSAAEEVTYQNIKKQNAELKRKIKNTATNETQIENLGKKFANLSKSQQKILQNTVN
jgi:DNA-binding ferritin-like protein